MAHAIYRPAEVLHWLGYGSEEVKDRASKRGQQALRDAGDRRFFDGVKGAAGAVLDLGRTAYVDLLRKKMTQEEYVLEDDHFIAAGLTSRRRFLYGDVRTIKAMGGDRFVVEGDDFKVTIRPIAHLVSGRYRVPIGWVRNGMEVPYGMLVDELAARCEVEVQA